MSFLEDHLQAKVSRRDVLGYGVAGGLSLLGLGACGGQSGQQSTSTSNAAPIPVRVGTLKLQHLIQPYFYQQFAGSKYNIQISTFALSAEARDALVNRSLDFLVIGHTVLLPAVQSSLPITMVALCCNGGAALISKAGGPVKGLSDLAGKKVGLARATPQDVMTRYLLKSNGLDSKVQYVQTPLADMRNALATGQIDVYCGAEPTPSMDLVEGKGQLVVPPSQLYSTPAHDLNAGLGVSVDFMNQKPDVVKDIVSYHFKANDFMKTHTDSWFSKTSELTGSTTEVCKKAAENITLVSAIDDKIVKETQDFATALKAEGYLQGDVDMKKYYTTKFQPK